MSRDGTEGRHRQKDIVEQRIRRRDIGPGENQQIAVANLQLAEGAGHLQGWLAGPGQTPMRFHGVLRAGQLGDTDMLVDDVDDRPHQEGQRNTRRQRQVYLGSLSLNGNAAQFENRRPLLGARLRMCHAVPPSWPPAWPLRH
ncbi:Uncharacterised protein [Mycobacteroides abscessus subsp. abscessus]|nr:Uncharacterised protein [Mycobacteroides abscessus subsp. abscessus]